MPCRPRCRWRPPPGRCAPSTTRSTDGGRAGRPLPAPGRPPGRARFSRTPTAAGSPASTACRARRPRRTADAGRCGRGPAARRARRRPRARCRDASSAGVASASPARVGSRLAPFRNSRSPLTEHTHSFHATSRSPVRRWRRSLNSPSTITSIDISVSGWSPSERGHHSAGLSMSRFQLTSLCPPASDRSDSAIGRPSTSVRTRTRRRSSQSRRA